MNIDTAIEEFVNKIKEIDSLTVVKTVLSCFPDRAIDFDEVSYEVNLELGYYFNYDIVLDSLEEAGYYIYDDKTEKVQLTLKGKYCRDSKACDRTCKGKFICLFSDKKLPRITDWIYVEDIRDKIETELEKL